MVILDILCDIGPGYPAISSQHNAIITQPFRADIKLKLFGYFNIHDISLVFNPQ